MISSASYMRSGNPFMRIEDQPRLRGKSLKGKRKLCHRELVGMNNIECSASPQLLNLPSHSLQIISLDQKWTLTHLATQPVIAICQARPAERYGMNVTHRSQNR
jgi:hypothetical protein